MNFYELQSRLDPQYQSRMSLLRQKVGAQYEIEQYRANQQMEVARFQANEASRREQDRADEFRETEKLRGENRIREMELDLDHRMKLIVADSAALVTQKTIDEGISTRKHLMDQIASRSQLRGDVFKMIAGAAIQEKLAQKQHQRDMERLKLESSLRRSEGYLDSLSAYLSRLIDSGQESKVRSEIDRLTREWEASTELNTEIENFVRKN